MPGAMKWEHIAKRWDEYQLNARRRWRLLTPGDLAAIAGERERLVAKIGERYAMPREQAERELAAWLEALRDVNPLR